MRIIILLLLQFLVFLPFAGFSSAASGAGLPMGAGAATGAAAIKAAAIDSYGRLPLFFIRNDGQADGDVRFYERGAGHAAFFTGRGVLLSLMRGRKARVVRLSFDGARKDAKIMAEGRLDTRVNFFRGKDPAGWRTDVPVYRKVVYRGVYRDIDIRFYGNNQRVEHDVVVRAGGDPDLVRFSYEGVKNIRVTDSGDLEVALEDGALVEERPRIYQEIDGRRVEVGGRYRVIESGTGGRATYGFVVGSYDRKRDLIIDPILDYSTYLGGAASDFGRDIAVDSTGAVYLTGWTMSTNFPTVTPVQGVYGGGLLTGDAFITKINPAGTAVVYSTYLGGTNDEEGLSITVDANGAAYVAGVTESFNFPVFNALQGVFGGGTKDAFLVKLSPAGNALVYSTYLGGTGNDKAKGIAVDASKSVYLTGWTSSLNFPVLTPVQPALAGLKDAFVTKIGPGGGAILYSTYIGGTNVDGGRDIAVNSAGEAYVTGHTWSFNFPLKNPIQGVFGGIKDVVVFKLNATGNALVFSTFLGGSATEKSKGIALNSNGAIYITGWTTSPDFPVLNPLQGALNGVQDAFIVKLAPPGRRIIYSTYFGGSDSDSGRDIAVDSADNVLVAGHTWSLDFPLVHPLQAAFGGLRDAFVIKVDPTGKTVIYSTYLGGSGDDTARGIGVDKSGLVYVGGGTTSINFPVRSPIQGTNAGQNDVFVARLKSGGGPAVTLGLVPDAPSLARGGTLGYTVTVANTTPITQCFSYWENVTLPGGIPFPSSGELFGPLGICVNANATKTAHLTKAVPVIAPVGTYVFNAFVGSPYPTVINTSGFNFNVTAVAPFSRRPFRKWRLLENGLVR